MCVENSRVQQICVILISSSPKLSLRSHNELFGSDSTCILVSLSGKLGLKSHLKVSISCPCYFTQAIPEGHPVSCTLVVLVYRSIVVRRRHYFVKVVLSCKVAPECIQQVLRVNYSIALKKVGLYWFRVVRL